MLTKLRAIYLTHDFDKTGDDPHDDTCFIYAVALLPGGVTNIPIQLRLTLDYDSNPDEYLGQLDHYWGQGYQLDWVKRNHTPTDDIIGDGKEDIRVKIVKKFQEGRQSSTVESKGNVYKRYLTDLTCKSKNTDQGCFFATSSSTRYTTDEVDALKLTGFESNPGHLPRNIEMLSQESFNDKLDGSQTGWQKVKFTPDVKASDPGWTLQYNTRTTNFEINSLLTDNWDNGLPLSGEVLFYTDAKGDYTDRDLRKKLNSKEPVDFILAAWIPVLRRGNNHIYTLVRPDFTRIPLHVGTTYVKKALFPTLTAGSNDEIYQQSLWNQLDKTTDLYQKHPVLGLGFDDKRDVTEANPKLDLADESLAGKTVTEVLDQWIKDNNSHYRHLFIPMKFTKKCGEGAHYVEFDSRNGRIREKCAGGRIPIGQYYYVEFVLAEKDQKDEDGNKYPSPPVKYPKKRNVDEGLLSGVVPLSGTKSYPASAGHNQWRVVLRLWARPNFVLSAKRDFCPDITDDDDEGEMWDQVDEDETNGFDSDEA
mmetsp:Transcript_15903/g.17747  ORF Transcript_15903/g.17747 Transcript_15903/m.17747 type:complete len:533 (+) Transcript_15903:634-2232(+)